MMQNDISKLCRCCMEEGGINIFTTSFETQKLSSIIEQCLSNIISSEDYLPKVVCQECFNKLISYYSFLKNYRRIQVLLQDHFKSDKLVLEESYDLDAENIQIDSKLKCDSSDDDRPLSALCATRCHLKRKVNSDDTTHIKTSKKRIKSTTNDNLKSVTISQDTAFYSTLNDSIATEICTDRISETIQSKKEQLKTSQQKHNCSECRESFDFIKHLEKHCKDTGHSFPRKFSCEVCSKKFMSSTHLNDHMRIHNNERPYSCNECGMTFTLSSNLKRHKKRHTGEKSHFCEICGRGFIQKHTLTVHMRLHSGETPYVCELCGKGYRAKPLLHQHMFKHKDTEIQTIKYRKYYLKYGKVKVECQVCKKTITKSALYNHMKVQHGDGPKKFLCNQCGKTYATKMSLDVHMNVHTKKISYDCNVCSKSFTHQNYLKTHLMVHSGERPHCCDLCGKTFVQRTHLDRHMRTHTGVRPYVCTYCDRAFALNENLKVHIRIHTGETPHYCSICGKGFFNSSSKKKHESRVHQIKNDTR